MRSKSRALATALLFLADLSARAIAGPNQEAAVACPEGINRDIEIMTVLGYLVTAASVTSPARIDVRDELNRARGGNDSNAPLGCYFCNPKLIFGSIYPAEPSDRIVAWTYDLRRFMKEQVGASDIRRPMRDIDAMPGYRKVREFALCWWQSKSASFADLLPLSQQAFVYDAIIDAVNIWSRYELLSGIGSADSVMYNDAVLNTYRSALASDIFF